MMRTRAKLEKLERRYKPEPPIIILMEDQELTEEQQLDIARAEAAGIEPYIIRIVRASKQKQAETGEAERPNWRRAVSRGKPRRKSFD